MDGDKPKSNKGIRDHSHTFTALEMESLDRARSIELTNAYRRLIRENPQHYFTESEASVFSDSQIARATRKAPFRYVVVNLPSTDDSSYHTPFAYKIKKAMSKVWLNSWMWTFELGERGTHPHFNLLFDMVVKRCDYDIRREFASTFKIEMSFVHVQHVKQHDLDNVFSYITKEVILPSVGVISYYPGRESHLSYSSNFSQASSLIKNTIKKSQYHTYKRNAKARHRAEEDADSQDHSCDSSQAAISPARE